MFISIELIPHATFPFCFCYLRVIFLNISVCNFSKIGHFFFKEPEFGTVHCSLVAHLWVHSGDNDCLALTNSQQSSRWACLNSVTKHLKNRYVKEGPARQRGIDTCVRPRRR